MSPGCQTLSDFDNILTQVFFHKIEKLCPSYGNKMRALKQRISMRYGKLKRKSYQSQTAHKTF